MAECAFLGEEVHDLGEEERIALGLLDDPGEHLGRGIDVGGGADVRGRLVAVEAAQR